MSNAETFNWHKVVDDFFSFILNALTLFMRSLICLYILGKKLQTFDQRQTYFVLGISQFGLNIPTCTRYIS